MKPAGFILLLLLNFIPIHASENLKEKIPGKLKNDILPDRELADLQGNNCVAARQRPLSNDSRPTIAINKQTPSYVDEFFNEHPAFLEGVIKNYDAVSDSLYLKIIADDYLSGNANFPLDIQLLPNGRFRVKLPNPHAHFSHLWIGDSEAVPFYSEPGKTVGMAIEISPNGSRVEFTGELGQLNTHLQLIEKQAPPLNPFFIYEEGVTEMHPQQFAEEYTRRYKNTLKQLEEFGANHQAYKKAIELVMYDNLILYITKMLEFAIHKSQTEEVPATYYSFLNELPQDNPHFLVSKQTSSMIGRLHNILLDKLGKQNGWPANFTRVITENANDPGRYAYQQLLNLLEQEEKILKDSLQLKNQLLADILKLHSFSTDLANLPTNEKAQFATEIKDKIGHPYLKRQLDKLVVLDAATSHHKPFELPAGEVRDFIAGLTDRYPGKYLLVDFWGIDCGFCKEEIQNTFELRSQYAHSSEIEFIFITSTSLSPRVENYERFVADQQLKNSLRIEPKIYNNICNKLMFIGIPHYILIDKSGAISSTDFSVFRIMSEATLQKIISGK